MYTGYPLLILFDLYLSVHTYLGGLGRAILRHFMLQERMSGLTRCLKVSDWEWTEKRENQRQEVGRSRLAYSSGLQLLISAKQYLEDSSDTDESTGPHLERPQSAQ